MVEIKIRGYDYKINLARDSFNRRAIQYTNQIMAQFRSIGLTNDDVEVSEERMAMKKAPANVSWWIHDERCHFSFNKMARFVDNLLVVSKVIEHNIDELIAEEITIEDFIKIFREHDGFDEKRVKAREFFDLEEDHINLEEINKKYKSLAKTLHPDMPTGDHEKFKELNEHHKTLKRELE
jgi:hypothetical protein